MKTFRYVNPCWLTLAGTYQGFQKTFSDWGLNFKQKSGPIWIFEILGHSYKNFISKNKYVHHRWKYKNIKPERNDSFWLWWLMQL